MSHCATNELFRSSGSLFELADGYLLRSPPFRWL